MLIKKLLFMSIVFLFVSCRSEYLSLNYEIHHGPVWNSNRSSIAFVASKTAYRSPEGIARFPDGGVPQYLLEDMGLYMFDIENNALTQLLQFSDLAERIGSSRSKWKVDLDYADSVIYFSIRPTTDWELYLKNANNKNDSLQIDALRSKYNASCSFSIGSGSVAKTDTDMFASHFQKSAENDKIGLSKLNNILSDVPLADWGLIVQEIYPKPDKAYIEETIYLHNNSAKTRRAVVEQIISNMNKEQIGELITKMDKHKNKLEGIKRTEYELYSKETYEALKKLLR